MADGSAATRRPLPQRGEVDRPGLIGRAADHTLITAFDPMWPFRSSSRATTARRSASEVREFSQRWEVT